MSAPLLIIINVVIFYNLLIMLPTWLVSVKLLIWIYSALGST